MAIAASAAGNKLQLLLKLTKALNKQPLGPGPPSPPPEPPENPRKRSWPKPPKCCSLLGPKLPGFGHLCLAV